MKKWLLICICASCACCPDHKIYAQAELVPNNGFETIAVCPVGFSQFEDFVSTWVDPNTASPDYMNACANPFPAGVPKNGTGYQSPHSGDAYAGIYTFAGTLYREFIQVQLVSPLTAGTNYAFSMYVVLHNKSNTAIDDLGVYFSATAPTAAGTGMLAGAPLPQIANPFGSVISDTLNWTFISGTYTATGGEQYLTIGHLKPDAATTYQPVPFGSQGAYYYIDDVSLKEMDLLPVTLYNFSAAIIHEQNTVSTQIKWSTATEFNNCCFYVERSENGYAFSDIGIVQGSGNSTMNHDYVFYDPRPAPGINYYRLRQQDINGYEAISEIISVHNNAVEPGLSFVQSGHTLLFNSDYEEAQVGIYNLAGQEISEFKIPEGNLTYYVPANLQGMFIVRMYDLHFPELAQSQKIIVN